MARKERQGRGWWASLSAKRSAERCRRQILEMPSPKRSIAGSSRAYLIGKEGKRPTFILQLTSTSTSFSTRQHQSFNGDTNIGLAGVLIF